MNTAGFLHGDAGEVANEICSCDPQVIPHGDLIAALANALNRIKQLEQQIKKVDDAAYHASNIASCLANGIQPD